MKNPFILDGTEKPMARAREAIVNRVFGKDEIVLSNGIKIWRSAAGSLKIDRQGQPSMKLEDLDADGLIEVCDGFTRPSNPFLK